MASIRTRLIRVKGDRESLIDAEAVTRACRDAGHHWRRRRLDPLRTLQLFATQIAHGNTAIAHLVRLAGGGFSESAYCQARARLPVVAIHAAFDAFNARLDAARVQRDGLWRGHRVVLIDGTGVSTPDSPALRALFGTASGCAEGCGLPLMRVLAAIDAYDGRLRALHLAPARTHDARHAHDLHPALESGDVVVGDRGLCAYTLMALLISTGCHGVFRVASTREMPFPARVGPRRRRTYNRHRVHEPVLMELISRDDQVVEVLKPRNRPRYLSPETFAAIPGKMIVRAVRYRTGGPGVRAREVTLLSTLTDSVAYPAEALAALYHMRWRVEVGLRDLKRTLGMDRLKCRSVEGVKRELLMFALIYNAVCRVRVVAARESGIEPTRMSFVDALRAMQIARPRLVITLARPPTLKVWPERHPRAHPRALKRPHSDFRTMKRPRTELVHQLHHAFGSN